MKELLRRLIQFHTVHDDHQAMHEAIDFVADFVVRRGMHVERYDYNGAEALVATVKQGEKKSKVLLAAHLDVIPAPDELFEMREMDGKLYGRGTLDMKFAIAAYLQLIDELQAELDDYDIGLMITTDEEQGGDSVAQLLKEGYLPQVAILPDGGDQWQIQLHSKGFLRLRLTTRGVTAHASRPWLGQNAILPLIAAVQEVQNLSPHPTADANSTISVGTISGGSAVNQVADHAVACIDVRHKSNTEKQQLLQKIESLCHKYGVELEITLQGPVAKFSLDNPFIAPFAQAIIEVTGIQIKGSNTHGSNDARYFAEQGIPCVSLYPPGAGHHGPAEWIDEKAFYQFKEILRLYLDRVAYIKTRDPLLRAIEEQLKPLPKPGHTTEEILTKTD